MKNIKTVIKYSLLTCLAVLVALGGYVTYLRLPTGTDIELTKPPALTLAELISIADKNQTANLNLDAASTFRRSDPIFEAIIAIQQERWGEARELLTPLAEQGNADALFWLGDLTYRRNAFSGWEGAELFEKSAKLGNPYAAIKLSPRYNSPGCERRMGSYCKEKWGELGLDILRKKADAGDIKAAYSYLLYTRFDDGSSDYFERFLDVVERGIEIKYYRPLRHLVDMYQRRENLNPYNSDIIPLEEEDRKTLAKLLMIAAENNDIPSIKILNNRYLDVISSQRAFDEIVENNLNALDSQHYFISYDFFLRKFNQSNERDFLIHGYAYAMIYDKYGEEGQTRYRRIFEMRLEERGISALTQKEKNSAKNIFEKQLDKQKFSAYIDEVRDAYDFPTGGY
ncbi:hypothetical protein L1D52_04340 [Vibrio brasiliensis]|uniref:hypothetical protein n=1 Tax=Vibrio brasiliensis TaxID=170652 RepID=UPI001EFC4226|nr:hypothetical protein [Vibrio brasiliensis]MCG9781571.1 hypothetical protein [Vibrio brasiliensis]